MLYEAIAAVCAGLFAGAAVYITFVEHPARLECGTAAAVAEFAPSYRRATIMQASLGVIGSLAAIGGWWHGGERSVLIAGLLLGSVIPFTLVVILPTNTRLLAPSLQPDSREADALLRRWGRLHLYRSAASLAAFVILVAHLVHAL